MHIPKDFLMSYRIDRHYTGRRIEIGSEPLEGSRFD
jgi:hypothetical protein